MYYVKLDMTIISNATEVCHRLLKQQSSILGRIPIVRTLKNKRFWNMKKQPVETVAPTSLSILKADWEELNLLRTADGQTVYVSKEMLKILNKYRQRTD